MLSERKKGDDDKENSKQENRKKAVMLEDLQNMIKDYRKSSIDKRQQHNQYASGSNFSSYDN